MVLRHIQEHSLKLNLNGDTVNKSCSACNGLTEGKGRFYYCSDLSCRFVSHKHCAELPPQISNHPFYPQHTTLSLCFHDRNRSTAFSCDACGNLKASFYYLCNDCDFNLDVACASLVPDGKEEDEPPVVHPTLHPGTGSHNWISCHMRQEEKLECFCSLCQIPIRNSVYICLDCKLTVHRSCASKLRIDEHPLHPIHLLMLFPRSTRTDTDESEEKCVVCQNYLNLYGDRFEYRCVDCTVGGFKLHVRCALFLHSTYDFHNHPFFLQYTGPGGGCSGCGNYCSIPFLSCTICNLSFHFHCFPSLPRTVMYERHVHPLELVVEKIKDDPNEDDRNQFYCDACEALRALYNPTYYCRECSYVAHIRCVISDEILFSKGREMRDEGDDLSEIIRREVEEKLKMATVELELVTEQLEELMNKSEKLTAKIEDLKKSRYFISPGGRG